MTIQNNVISLIDKIREESRQIGYDARMSAVFINNPYLPGNKFYEHWQDGYDLGVRDANLVLFSIKTIKEN